MKVAGGRSPTSFLRKNRIAASVAKGTVYCLPPTCPDSIAGRRKSPLTMVEQFDVVLGIACHAIYHAGQIQLIKRLAGE